MQGEFYTLFRDLSASFYTFIETYAIFEDKTPLKLTNFSGVDCSIKRTLFTTDLYAERSVQRYNSYIIISFTKVLF